jgi:hypothetical protein
LTTQHQGCVAVLFFHDVKGFRYFFFLCDLFHLSPKKVITRMAHGGTVMISRMLKINHLIRVVSRLGALYTEVYILIVGPVLGRALIAGGY